MGAVSSMVWCRMTREQLNTLVDQLQETFVAKYKILSGSKTKLSDTVQNSR